MKIHVRDITSDDLAFEKKIDAGEIGLADDDFNVLTPLAVDAMISRAENEVIARVRVTARYGLTCSRCLDRIESERTDKFDLYFDITPRTDTINIGEDIRQELFLALTSAGALCREECKGLCPNCGVNLNREECHHGSSETTTLKTKKA